MNKKIMGLAYLQIIERETENLLTAMLGENMNILYSIDY